MLKSATVPLIVVYTKLDSFVDELMMQLAVSSGGKLDDKSLAKNAISKAQSSVQELHNEITRLAGEALPYAVVSGKRVGIYFEFFSHCKNNLAKEDYKYTLQNLVELTHHQVGIPNTPEAQITSTVTLMAQRVDPHLKIQGCIK